MKYADKLINYIGVEGNFNSDVRSYYIEYGRRLPNYKGTIKEVGDDFVVKV